MQLKKKCNVSTDFQVKTSPRNLNYILALLESNPNIAIDVMVEYTGDTFLGLCLLHGTATAKSDRILTEEDLKMEIYKSFRRDESLNVAVAP